MSEDSEIVSITDTNNNEWKRMSNDDPLIEVWQIQRQKHSTWSDAPSIIIRKRRVYKEGQHVRVKAFTAKITNVMGDRVKLQALTRSGYVYWTLALDEIEPID